MRNFHIPFDMHTEDKIIGGYLSLRQLAWLLGGAGITVYLFAINKSYITADGVSALRLALRIIFSLAILSVAVFMAFVQLDEMEADKFLLKKVNFKMKNRIIKYTDRK